MSKMITQNSLGKTKWQWFLVILPCFWDKPLQSHTAVLKGFSTIFQVLRFTKIPKVAYNQKSETSKLTQVLARPNVLSCYTLLAMQLFSFIITSAFSAKPTSRWHTPKDITPMCCCSHSFLNLLISFVKCQKSCQTPCALRVLTRVRDVG